MTAFTEEQARTLDEVHGLPPIEVVYEYDDPSGEFKFWTFTVNGERGTERWVAQIGPEGEIQDVLSEEEIE